MQTPVATMVHRFDFESLGQGRCRLRQHEYAEGLLAILTWPLRNKVADFDHLLARDLQAAFSKA